MERLDLSQELAREVLDKAKAKGATQGDIVMVEGDSFFVTVRLGEVEKISQAQEKRLGLRLFYRNSSASASTSDISRKAIDKLVEDTITMARFTAQDQDHVAEPRRRRSRHPGDHGCGAGQGCHSADRGEDRGDW